MTSAGIVNPLSIDPNERVTPSHHHMMPTTDHTGDILFGFSKMVLRIGEAILTRGRGENSRDRVPRYKNTPGENC